MGSIPSLGRCPEKGNGNPLQYSCLENPMDRGAWRGYSPWGRKIVTTERLNNNNNDKLLYLKCITNKDLLYSTWNSGRCYVAVCMRGESGGEWIHVYVWLSPFAVHLKLSQCCLLISYTPIQNKRFFKKQRASH